jgi:two-component system, sensor histidine kinase and response regulator
VNLLADDKHYALSTHPLTQQPLEQNLNKLTNRHILVVEDNEINQEVTVNTLETAGVISTIAENGQVALDLISKNDYDLVLMDVQMPIMDGLEATRRIRETGNPISIIAMTANVFKDDQEDCISAGMNDFVSKPIDPQRFFDTITQWLPEKAVRQNQSKTMTIMVDNHKITGDCYVSRLNEIDGLDVPRGLSNLQGNAKKMYELMNRMTSDYLNRINTCFADPTVATTEIKHCAHALKGASGNLGWTQVHAQTEIIEKRIQGGEDVSAMIKDITKLKSQLEQALTVLEKPFEITASLSLVDIDTKQLRDTLNTAEEFLLAFDTSGLDVIDAKKDALNSLDGTLTDQLISAIQSFEFTQAIKIIHSLKELIP